MKKLFMLLSAVLLVGFVGQASAGLVCNQGHVVFTKFNAVPKPYPTDVNLTHTGSVDYSVRKLAPTSSYMYGLSLRIFDGSTKKIYQIVIPQTAFSTYSSTLGYFDFKAVGKPGLQMSIVNPLQEGQVETTSSFSMELLQKSANHTQLLINWNSAAESYGLSFDAPDNAVVDCVTGAPVDGE